MSDKLEGATEENVLTMLCWDETHASGLTLRVTADLFSTRAYRLIAEETIKYIGKFNRPPRAHLRDILETRLRKGEEGRALNDALKNMEQLAPLLQPAYVIETLNAFIEERTLSNHLEAAASALANKDILKARSHMSDASIPGIGHNSGGVWMHDHTAMLRWMNKAEDDDISCGIDTFDDRGLTLARKTMTVMIAPAKGGKTWWLIQIAKRAKMRGKKVLHITLENSEDLTAQRYLQAFLVMTKRHTQEIRSVLFRRSADGKANAIDFDVREPEALLGVGRARLLKELKRMDTRAPMLIKEFATSTFSSQDLNGYLDYLLKVQKFQPDLLLVDYPNLMKIQDKDLRVGLGRTFKELRGICVERNMALATVTQGSKLSAQARVVNETMVAEDWSIIGTADNVLTYSQTLAEKRLGIARMMVANARDAEDKYVAMLSQNYATGQFCLDDVFMSHVLEDEVRRFSDGDEAEKEDD